MRDFGAEAQAAAEKHLAACMDAEDAEGEDSPAVAPFCGCPTCIVREVLAAAWDVVDQYIEDCFEDGVGLIATERRRQLTDEHWTGEHDDKHSHNELASAAACYLLASRFPLVAQPHETPPSEPPAKWPWDPSSWKPRWDDPVRMLVKSGALIAAEIDRLQRVHGK